SAVKRLLLCLSPYAPHLAEELWAELHGRSAESSAIQDDPDATIANQSWPSWDEALCVDDVVTIPVQVNGKVRGRVELARQADEQVAREAALNDEAVQKFVEGKSLRKVVYVPGRILNLIVN